ncbi:hypothetical protein [Dickeya oryzae]|uniref:hypothetical protein n=1 Tax=Dickeya oryzae TaxID=1240404 RepID=UPI001FEDDC28|nr:hypothetical protein [Dickeya oryzae]
MAQTIDELLISLGLKMDAKSFQKGQDAIKGVSDKTLQLAAVAGTGMGFRALTSGVAQTALESPCWFKMPLCWFSVGSTWDAFSL